MGRKPGAEGGGRLVKVLVRMPEELMKELRIRVPIGEINAFIREAVLEKLFRTPKPDKILELETRMKKVEDDLSSLKKLLSDLELLTYKPGEVDVRQFCQDSLDRKIMNYLLQHRGATTPELAEFTGYDRQKVLGRLMRIRKLSKAELGKPIVEFDPGEREGKKRAWWLTIS
jgi:hypothetical protein